MEITSVALVRFMDTHHRCYMFMLDYIGNSFGVWVELAVIDDLDLY